MTSEFPLVDTQTYEARFCLPAMSKQPFFCHLPAGLEQQSSRYLPTRSTITKVFFVYDLLIYIGLFPFFEGNIQVIGCQIEKKYLFYYRLL